MRPGGGGANGTTTTSNRRSIGVLSAVALRALLAGCTSDGAKAVADRAGEADHLRGVERARLSALVGADVAAARRVTADDFQLINPADEASSRDAYLDAIGSATSTTSG